MKHFIELPNGLIANPDNSVHITKQYTEHKISKKLLDSRRFTFIDGSTTDMLEKDFQLLKDRLGIASWSETE